MIRILGGVVVSEGGLDDAGQVPALERKARELLALLVLHAPAALGADELARLLWEAPPPSARRTLRSHVSRIRSALEELGHPGAVESVRGDLFRLGDAVETDVAEVGRLRRLARQLSAGREHDAAADQLELARRWWRGSPILPATVAGQALRTGWERERRLLAREHLEAVARGSRPRDSLGALAHATADDPLDESAWVLYVTALHRSGLQADALAAVAAARAALTEVGLDPGPELVAAQASVLAGSLPQSPGGRPDEPVTGPASPRVHYTDTGDTAYVDLTGAQARSDVSPVLVLNPAMITIDGLLDEPHVRSTLRYLAAQRRVLCLDRRGIGLSAPLVSDQEPLSQWVDDVRGVLSHAGLHHPVVLANFDTGLVALEYAARHPTSLAGLVLVNCYATYRRSADYPHGLDPATTSELITAAVDPGRAEPLDTSALVAPSMASDEGFRAWWNRIGQRGASPTTARIVRETATRTDLRARLHEVTCPVLVVPRRHCVNVDPGHSFYLADHLPRAELRPLDGTDGVWLTGGHDVADQVVRFTESLS